MEVPQNVIQALNDADNILIQAHTKPDGDAIGSAIALGKGLKNLGKEVDYFIDDNIEPKLKFFPEIENFNQNLKDHYDALVIVDCSTKDYSVFPQKDIDYDQLIVIDHHKSNKNYGDLNFVYESGACGELVFQVLEGLNAPIDNEMREALFTALSSDTGSFQFSNTTNQTHEIASQIYTDEIDFAPISKRLHSIKTLEQMQMFAKAIDSIRLYHNGEIAILDLPYDFIEAHGGVNNITDDISNIGMNLDTTKVSVLIKELSPDDYKMSIRSKSPFDIDVSKIALKHNGGGHFRASGFSGTGDLKEIETNLVNELIELVEE